MAKKSTPVGTAVVSKKPAKTVSTPVRNSAIPKSITKATTARKPVEISNELIARKAYEIFASGKGGSELDNWFAAERELKRAA
jgi:hypothetical protein